MKPVFVADIGNTRTKFGLMKDDRIHGVFLGEDNIENWDEFRQTCEQLAGDAAAEMFDWSWTVAAVYPEKCQRFAAGLRELGFSVRMLNDYRELPLKVDVDAPERVGIDRLLAAVAVTKRSDVGSAAAIVSAGTAVTIDLVDSAGTFRGGVILPGFRMMARGLHDYTALLPHVEDLDPDVGVPARNTEAAISGGIAAAISGAVDRVVERYRFIEPALKVIVTGGDAEWIKPRYCKPEIRPILTLVGLTVVAHGEQ
jgi:type III pantothenate kinase